MPTKTDDLTLNAAQEVALLALLGGASVTDAAVEAKVTRQTVSEWTHHHPGFMAALAAGRKAAHEAVQDRMRDLGTKALDVVERELDRDDASPDVALDVLKLLAKMSVPGGETDPRTLHDQFTMREMSRW
jgi:hypothetical protein